MRKGLTEIVFILDRSGSMSGLEADTIGGFNSMIDRQRKEDGDAYISTYFSMIRVRCSMTGSLGTNMDAIEVAGCFSIGADRTINYECDSEGTALNYQVLFEMIFVVRRSESMEEINEAFFDCCEPIREDYRRCHNNISEH